MRIARSLIDQMVAHAREDLPNECCGLIGGRNGEGTSVYPMRNEFESPLRYRLHSDDNLRVSREMDAAGEEMVGVYHSHTKSEAYPSQTDLNEAEPWPEPMYVIVSLKDSENPVVEGYWLRDKKITHAELEVA